MLNHKRRSTNLLGYSSGIQFKPAQNLPSEAPKPESQNTSSAPRFKLPLQNLNRKIKEEDTEPSEDLALTDRTQKRSQRIDLGGISSSRSSHRLKHCSDIFEAHTQSIHFYMNELKRREEEFVKKKDELEKDHVDKVYYLERLLKAEINKNIRLDEELRRAKQRNKDNRNCSKNLLAKDIGQLSDKEVVQLFRELKRELDHRYDQDADISRIKGTKSYISNDLVLSYSKTDESLLLGDVARHF